MTRQEFITTVYDFGALEDLCRIHDLDTMANCFCRDELNGLVMGRVSDFDDFEALYNWLGDISTDYEWYIEDDWGDIIGIDHDFDAYKAGVLNEMDELDLWDVPFAAEGYFEHGEDSDSEDEELDEISDEVFCAMIAF